MYACLLYSASVLKLNKMFFGHFDPDKIRTDNENNYFLGWPNRYSG